ncbi:Lcl domain-containing protein [Acinetobacter radioresistens]|uniref:Lcl domain-containing protein n=1 Tax=Acinetobacter radioresistens TaxID=40216 RepID=UPI002246044C|nr:DUF1566 domain-containing protein [Acinetobacter radioresistens]MCX0340140.1 DUF1566 domain-containing protein [Acinetobacter radioresistens]
MSQSFETFVPTLKHQKLLATAEAIALEKDKAEDAKTLKQATEDAVKYFEQYRYWWINEGEMIFDRETGLLWQGNPSSNSYCYDEQQQANQDLVSLKLGGLNDWRVPSDTELWKIIEPKNFPLKNGSYLRLDNYEYWLTQNNNIFNLDSSDSKIIIVTSGGYSYRSNYKRGRVIAINSFIQQNFDLKDKFHILNEFLTRKWKIRPHGLLVSKEIVNSFMDKSKYTYDSKKYVQDNIAFWSDNYCWYEDIDSIAAPKLKEFLGQYADEPLKKFYQNLDILEKSPKKKYDYKPQVDISEIWQTLDYLTTRLPKIDTLRFTDVEQGMWEFFAPKALQAKYTKVQSKQFFRDRNPVLDIQEANVAIDFGTSSTVVAIRTNGKDELLRIGMQEKDFAKDTITDQQYENPTVLEFRDLQNFLKEWHSESYRPLVDWDNIHCSHEARAALRNNNSNTKVVSSIFARLKQWALRKEQMAKVRLRDQQEYEYQLQPLTEYNPVKGQAIQIGKDYPQLDPIEVYAWFLGMTINWRERGIFLNYYLTFPVKYSNEVKARILAAFRRGLQRSLPESLIYDERFNEFSVEELASEPAAFAAAALERLAIEPDDGGVSYAVFDFGGGTTDFDYGFYRNPNDEEYDEGWDHVIEHFGSSGDQFLGGENLLENLAYLVFQANSSECNKKKIAFTKPIDAEVFAGSELLIAQTQAAYTNTTLMMSKLRPLWEAGKIDLDSKGTETFKLINKDGQTVDCEIAIKQDELIKFLENRIRQGLKDFFIAMNVAFKQQHQKFPELIHILLAGNSSRSRIVLGLLGCLDDEKSKALYQLLLADLAEIFEELSNLEIHLPLDADSKNAYAPTAKTGVALGLLRLCPGETLKVVNHAAEDNTDSPFQYFIGAFRRDTLQVAIHRGQTYQEWAEIGKPLNGVLVMGYTTSSSAALENQVKRGDKGVFEQNLRLSGNVQGHKVFAKVLSPNEIEICTAQSLESVHQQETSNNRIIQLTI